MSSNAKGDMHSTNIQNQTDNQTNSTSVQHDVKTATSCPSQTQSNNHPTIASSSSSSTTTINSADQPKGRSKSVSPERNDRSGQTATTGDQPTEMQDEQDLNLTKEQIQLEKRMKDLLDRRKNRDPHLVVFDYNDPEDPRNFPTWRKWQISMVAFLTLAWINVISSIYAPGVDALAADFGISVVAARVAQAIYLYGLSAGPVFLAPLSEDYGRYWTHTISILIVALTQIPCALSQNLGLLLPFRYIAGVFGAVVYNSVGTVADLWTEEEQSWPINGFALSAEFGAVLGPIFGSYLLVVSSWRWLFALSGFGTAFLLVVWVLTVPETRAGVLLSRRAAKKRKETGDDRWFAEHERIRKDKNWKEMIKETLLRPAWMLFTEPIVFWFALFDGFNYAIIYLFLEAFAIVYGEEGFNLGPARSSLPFFGVLIGFVIAFCLYYYQLRYESHAARKSFQKKEEEEIKQGLEPQTKLGGGALDLETPPEARLMWLMPAGVLFPISLFWFAWTSMPEVPVIVSVIAGGAFGLSSHMIFIAVSSYTIVSYGNYAASAVAGQSFAREILSGSVNLFADQMYHNLGNQWASSLLGFIGIPLAAVPFILYRYGPIIRARSSFATEIAEANLEFKRMAEEDHAEAIMLQRQKETEQRDGNEKI